MKCVDCSFYKKEENTCIKMEQGKISELEGSCLLRYLINQIEVLIDMVGERDGEDWKG